MGGDHGCDVVIDGIKLALHAYRDITELHVVGDQKLIEAAMVRSKLKDPRVGILSNGKEEMKGNELTREALKLLQQVGLNFIGYVEGYDMFNDHVEVVVTDGFIGNLVLKTIESMGKSIVRLIKRELAGSTVRKLGAALAAQGFRNIKQRMDPDAYGGAPLLGLNGNVIKAHGSSRDRAIMNAIRVSTEAIQHHLKEMIQEEIQRVNQRLPQPAVAASASVAA